jgi:hypothetical protein
MNTNQAHQEPSLFKTQLILYELLSNLQLQVSPNLSTSQGQRANQAKLNNSTETNVYRM